LTKNDQLIQQLVEGQEELKTDVALLKEGQKELKEGQNKLTAVVINIENILLTKLNILFDADSSRVHLSQG